MGCCWCFPYQWHPGFFVASSGELAGTFRLGKPSEGVINGDFAYFQGSLAVGFSDTQFDLVLQSLHDTPGELLLCPEPVENQLAVAANTSRDFLGLFQAASHRALKRAVEEPRRPTS